MPICWFAAQWSIAFHGNAAAVLSGRFIGVSGHYVLPERMAFRGR